MRLRRKKPAGDDGGHDEEIQGASSPTDKTQGPWDVSERPDTSDDYTDLGPLKVPDVEGHELRLQADQQTGAVVSCLLAGADSGADLRVFAAPRSSDIWPGILDEIQAEADGQGAQTERRDGDLGPELVISSRQSRPDGVELTHVSRVVGIDGPRWMLRVTYMGDLARRPDAASALERGIRDVVVDRGSEPRAPRDLLPLSAPAQA